MAMAPEGNIPAPSDTSRSIDVRDNDRRLLKAQQLLDAIAHRNRIFRHPVMADMSMAIMLRLFLGAGADGDVSRSELLMSESLLGLEPGGVIRSLIDAGLIEERRVVALGLTQLGTARTQCFLSDLVAAS